MDLNQKWDFKAFEITSQSSDVPLEIWRTQQGVVFISPALIAVYQVQERPESYVEPAPRDESGGAGRYQLKVVFVDATNGNERAAWTIRTSSGFSQILPTHDGMFIVRTGDMMRVFSDDLKEMASRNMPFTRDARIETWLAAVRYPGREIYLEHDEDFGYKEGFRNQRLLVDADSLKDIKVLSQNVADTWPPDDSLPQYWRFRFPTETLSHNEQLYSIEGADSVIAGEIRRKPSAIRRGNPRLVVFDIESRKKLCTISLEKPVSYGNFSDFFSLSKSHILALIQGTTLTIYQLPRLPLSGSDKSAPKSESVWLCVALQQFSGDKRGFFQQLNNALNQSASSDSYRFSVHEVSEDTFSAKGCMLDGQHECEYLLDIVSEAAVDSCRERPEATVNCYDRQNRSATNGVPEPAISRESVSYTLYRCGVENAVLQKHVSVIMDQNGLQSGPGYLWGKVAQSIGTKVHRALAH